LPHFRQVREPIPGIEQESGEFKPRVHSNTCIDIGQERNEGGAYANYERTCPILPLLHWEELYAVLMYEANVMSKRHNNNRTMRRVSRLYHLKELDREIDNNHARIEEVNTIMADKSGFAAARKALEIIFRCSY
jgi:hypothetical protein